MIDTVLKPGARSPRHLVPVGLLATLWNGFGCADYLMSRIHHRGWMEAMMPGVDPALVWAFLDGMPLWAGAGWGLAVWSALGGSLALVARRRAAVPLFALSLAGMAVSFGYQLGIARDVPAGMDNPAMAGVIAVAGVALFLYARAMRACGALR